MIESPDDFFTGMFIAIVMIALLGTCNFIAQTNKTVIMDYGAQRRCVVDERGNIIINCYSVQDPALEDRGD